MDTPNSRLTILLPGLYGGGAERIILNLAEGISAKGFSVDLVLARAEGPYMSQIPDCVRVIDLKATRVLMCMPALIRYLRNERPVALLSALHTNVIAVWSRRVAGFPQRVVLSEHNNLSNASNGEKDLRWKLFPELEKWFYPWAEGIVAVSKGVADDLARVTRLPSSQIQVIYNPIITPDMRKKSECSLEHPWFRPGEPPVVLGVGRLTSQKAFSVLIEAFARVRESQLARLLILGEGPERPMLEALIKQLKLEQDVELPGFVSNPYPYMAQSAVLALSSRWEGLPTVLVEAMSLGTPVIATDCPSGPREILMDGKYGRLVSVGDVHALADAIKVVLGGDVPTAPLNSWQPFELEMVVEQYLDVLLGRAGIAATA